MVKKKGSEKKDATDPNDVINTATSAASGVPKPIIDAANQAEAAGEAQTTQRARTSKGQD